MSHCCPPETRRRQWLAHGLMWLLGAGIGTRASASPSASPSANAKAKAPTDAKAQPGRPAAPRAVESFDASAWQALQREAERRRQPMLVVFSATWCGVCPEAIVRLADDRRRQRAQADLVVVVTDLAPGDDDARLLAAPHYARAQRLLAFDGSAAALRHAVQPGWSGTSPSVAWLAPGRAPQFMQGAPDERDLQRWFARR
ncbi:hypothetical protein [Aquabacterium sp. OR-4]|uniref:hypothetical protein n=1 Tax=Aquabacterium sp. OR-4 TaxID=2978127 RepID=UPI0021B18BC1|nr:hypothetical protein [Aquabacterium sp. OR-4]MDT7837069.1 hypothetical protein [Aquabacterium sp. OR-4]